MSWMVYWNSKTQQKYTCWTTKPINALHSAPISGFYCQNGSIDTTDLTQMTSSLGHQIVQLWTTSLLKWSLFFNAVNEDISKSCIRALNHWCKIKIKNVKSPSIVWKNRINFIFDIHRNKTKPKKFQCSTYNNDESQ